MRPGRVEWRERDAQRDLCEVWSILREGNRMSLASRQQVGFLSVLEIPDL